MPNRSCVKTTMKRRWLFPVIILRALALAAMALGGAGCYPLHVVSSPGASGIVMERQTRTPIGGAQVVISRIWEREWPNYGLPTVSEALAHTRLPLVTTS